MTMGLSFMYAPFFLVAHGFALISDYPSNGFSEPYKVFLLLSAIFYLFIGLDFLKKILRYYGFSDVIIAITILLTGLGTNLLCYASQSAPMSHVYNFCLFAIFIYYTIKWFGKQSIKNTLILGLLIGLIALIRPSNFVIAIFFILFGIISFSDFKERLILFKKKFLLLFLMVLMFFLVWIPQLLYWKTVTSHFLFYSYTDEGFFFNNPKIIDGLFSFRKGWLIYTPMMGFALIGIFYFKDQLKKLRFPIIMFLIVNIYIIFSWWCWWYGGCFGQRSLVESYALLSIPLASFVKYIYDKNIFYNILFYSIVIFFIWLNIFQTFQFEFFSLHWEGMSKKLYFKQFGKMDKITDYDSYVDWPNYDKAKFDDKYVKPEKKNEFNTSVIINDKKNKSICLQTQDKKYLCTDKSKQSILIADRDNAFLWETFTLELLENNQYTVRSFENMYLSVDTKNQYRIVASQIQAGKWETFTIVEVDDNFIALKSANDRYVSIDKQSLQLYANSLTIGKQQKFKIINK